MFNIQNLGQYRQICLNYNGLDIVQFYMSPGIAWYVALSITGAKSELYKDEDMDVIMLKGLKEEPLIMNIVLLKLATNMFQITMKINPNQLAMTCT